jgi:UDP-N-acetylmuramate--alanine ligase
MEEFATAFKDCDSLFLLDIYAASEAPMEGVTSEILAGKIAASSGHTTRYCSTFQGAGGSVAALAQPGDMILTLGAGNVGQLVPLILEQLRAKKDPASAANADRD